MRADSLCTAGTSICRAESFWNMTRLMRPFVRWWGVLILEGHAPHSRDCPVGREWSHSSFPPDFHGKEQCHSFFEEKGKALTQRRFASKESGKGFRTFLDSGISFLPEALQAEIMAAGFSAGACCVRRFDVPKPFSDKETWRFYAH